MIRNLIIFTMLFLLSCNGQSSLKFDGEKAYQYLVQQCDIGYRHPGSVGHEKAKNMYVDFLNNFADEVVIQEFEQEIPRDSVTFQLTNIIGVFGKDKGNGLLVGAHWDTRPRAEWDPNPANRDKPILGANDGASGIAVLMHLAELLKGQELDRTVYLVFFDGEDYGYHDNTDYFCMGSKYFAKNLPFDNISEAIIVDMVGDKNLEIPIERYSYKSHKELINTLWDIAEKHEFDAYQRQIGFEIYDDHVPLIEIANIPSVDLIDFTYPNKYSNYWHTQADTPDKCSGESLKQVGQVVLDYIMMKKD